MRVDSTTSELGKYKENISTALYRNEDIKRLLLGTTDNTNKHHLLDAFKEHVKSHLFIDDTITETDCFIFYDIVCPYMKSNIKSCQIIMYAICHRDILDNYVAPENYYGNRADVLTQMIENALINDKSISNKFGIGELMLDRIDIYNSKRFYGHILTFSVPTFR